MLRRTRLFLAGCTLLGVLGCNDVPADLREWRPTDHDHTTDPNPEQVQVTDGGSNSPAAKFGIDEVTIITWRNNCTTCHGTLGRGDGPQGPMVQAANLTDPAWQARVTDDAIAETIKNGKGRMPRFDIPDTTIQGLVRLIRLLNLARHQAEAASSASGAAGSAAPATPPGAHPARPAPARGAAPKTPVQ